MQFINPVIRTGMAPPISAMLNGTLGQDVIRSINDRWGGNTFFGTPADVFAARHQMFLDNIVARCTNAINVFQQTAAVVQQAAEPFIPLVHESMFVEPPPQMIVPILTYAPVRQMLERGQIHGYGVDHRILPDEDVAGRLIANGTATWTENQTPKQFHWTWRAGDPTWSTEDLRAIAETRGFIDGWLERAVRYPDEKVLDLTLGTRPE